MNKTIRQAVLRASSTFKEQPAIYLLKPGRLFWFAVGLLVVGLLISSADLIHAYRDDINAVSTIIIAIFTAVLAVFTISLARSTRVAAEAAKDAANAAVAAERATLYAIEVHDNLNHIMNVIMSYNGPWDSSHITVVPDVTILLKNYGKTPARIQAMCYGLKYSRQPFDFICELINQKEFIVEGGEATTHIRVTSDNITTREAKDIQEGRGYMWLYGRVYYKDVFDIPHVHKFYRRFARISDTQYGMRSYEYKDYNLSA